MALSPQWLDELKSRITLSALIMRTTKLTRAGHEWKACCPFHNEKTPSFYVNDAKGFYHCFGCQKHGGAIDWMMEQHGLEFMDAVKELAAEAGMDVPAPDSLAARRAEQRASLHDVMQAAQDWFVANLRGAEGAKAREYLASRGFDAATVERFGFGFAPDSKQALKEALSRFDESMLIEAGLRITVDGKPPYDRFRDRLMLPIQDARGRVIAFGGRILEKREGVAKYLNSPDTPLFDKGRTLYNLHRAGPASRRSGRVIAVEGYMDVIALAAAGFEDAVAPMGTALTEHQIELMWRFTDKPVLCFDGDTAGQRAALKAAERVLPILRPGHSVAFAHMPPGMDPDDVIRRHGFDYLKSLLGETTGLLSIVWESEFNQSDLDTPEGKADLRARLIERSFLIEDREIQRLYRRELLDLYYEELRPRKFQKPDEKSRHGFLDSASLAKLKYFVENGSRETLCKAVFAALARNPDLIPTHLERLYRYHPQDADVAYVLDVFFDVSESQLDGLDEPRRALAEIAEWRCPFRFPFLSEKASKDYISSCLTEAISILIDRPRIERAKNEATERYGRTFSEEDRLEQERLRDMDRRLVERAAKIRTLPINEMDS